MPLPLLVPNIGQLFKRYQFAACGGTKVNHLEEIPVTHDVHVDCVKHNKFYILGRGKGRWWEQKVQVELVLVPDLKPAQHEI